MNTIKVLGGCLCKLSKILIWISLKVNIIWRFRLENIFEIWTETYQIFSCVKKNIYKSLSYWTINVDKCLYFSLCIRFPLQWLVLWELCKNAIYRNQLCIHIFPVRMTTKTSWSQGTWFEVAWRLLYKLFLSFQNALGKTKLHIINSSYIRRMVHMIY